MANPIKYLKNNFKYLAAADIVNIAFLSFLLLLNIIFSSVIPYWFLLVLLNIVLICFIVYVVPVYEKNCELHKGAEDVFSFIKVFRYWYGIIFILVCFKEVYILIHFINPADYDKILIQLDYRLFGVNPTQWIYKYNNPLLTEFLQIIYMFYYIMIAIYGLELYLWKRYKEFKFAIFVIFIGFYIAYVLYLIFPAVGPRFYLHDFYSTSSELPGLYLTDIIRKMLDFGESIPGNVPNPVDFAQRDAMPSAHTSLALTIAYLSWKIKSKSFYFYLPYFFLMVFATIYLRYHYVVDIIAGTILAVLTIGIGEYLLKRSPEGKYGVIKKIQKMKNAPVKER